MLLEKPIPFRYVIREVRQDCFIVFFIALSAWVMEYEAREYLPDFPVSIPAFLGTAISLVLSFKLSQSYDRWWEARKVWGAIVNDSRTLVMQVKAFVADKEVASTVAFRQMAWCYSLGQSLRGFDAMAGLDAYLSEQERGRIQWHHNKPLAIIDLDSQTFASLLKEEKLNVFHHVQLDNTLVRLCESMGKAERINNTVFPKTYRLFLHFFIYVFVSILSLSLSGIVFWIEVPLILSITLPFFLLEKTATNLQDPFRNRPTDTSVTAIARTIEINLKQLIEEEPMPEPLQAQGFYVM